MFIVLFHFIIQFHVTLTILRINTVRIRPQTRNHKIQTKVNNRDNTINKAGASKLVSIVHRWWMRKWIYLEDTPLVRHYSVCFFYFDPLKFFHYIVD